MYTRVYFYYRKKYFTDYRVTRQETTSPEQ